MPPALPDTEDRRAVLPARFRLPTPVAPQLQRRRPITRRHRIAQHRDALRPLVRHIGGIVEVEPLRRAVGHDAEIAVAACQESVLVAAVGLGIGHAQHLADQPPGPAVVLRSQRPDMRQEERFGAGHDFLGVVPAEEPVVRCPPDRLDPFADLRRRIAEQLHRFQGTTRPERFFAGPSIGVAERQVVRHEGERAAAAPQQGRVGVRSA